MMKFKVKRPLSMWDSWLPLTVKLNDESAGAVRNGQETVITASGETSEMSVSYLHNRSHKVTVEDGDVITVKTNRTSRIATSMMILSVLIPLIPLLLGYDIAPFVWTMLVILAIILGASMMLKTYDIEHSGKMDEERHMENETSDGVHVRRKHHLFESGQPLSVKLNEEERANVKGGEQTVIPIHSDDAEMSVDFLYEAGNRVRVKTGDVVSIKRNWIFYMRLIILFSALLGPGLISLLGMNPGVEPALYGITVLTAIVLAGGMTLMKTVKVEVVDKAHN